MEMIQINIKDVLSMVPQAEIDGLNGCAAASLSKLVDGTGLGNDFLGWVKLPTDTPAELLDDIVATAAALCADFYQTDIPALQTTLQKNGVILHERDL